MPDHLILDSTLALWLPVAHDNGDQLSPKDNLAGMLSVWFADNLDRWIQDSNVALV